MVDLKGQYQKIKSEIDQAVISCLESSAFINGPAVGDFQKDLETYNQVKHVIPCANGTDALQIAMMALGLKPGDEVICPAFTYVATAEVIGLLGLIPIMVDVKPDTFCIDINGLEEVLTEKTKAIVPVHLYGQSADMEPLLVFAKKHNLFVIEDNAQAIGAEYTFRDGSVKKTGSMGHIGCTSFFPSKNLGCYGDGGAMMTNDDNLATQLRMIANHGQEERYYHKVLGCNSRLDTLQAEILKIKLRHLDIYNQERRRMAKFYSDSFAEINDLEIPFIPENTTHVFHQYTLKVKNGKRNEFQKFLSEREIPSMIYYPVPLYKQEAFQRYVSDGFSLPVTEQLSDEVISLPIHTEYDQEILDYIVENVKEFFKK